MLGFSKEQQLAMEMLEKYFPDVEFSEFEKRRIAQFLKPIAKELLEQE